MPDLCLTVLCPPAFEEKLLDLLLVCPEASLFTSTPTAEHGLEFGRLDATEQVLGHSRATQIQVLLSETDKAAVLELLRGHFAGSGMRYWLTALVEAGDIA